MFNVVVACNLQTTNCTRFVKAEVGMCFWLNVVPKKSRLVHAQFACRLANIAHKNQLVKKFVGKVIATI